MSPIQMCTATPSMEASAPAAMAVGMEIFRSARNKSTMTVYTAISTPTPIIEARVPPTRPAARPIQTPRGAWSGAFPLRAQISVFLVSVRIPKLIQRQENRSLARLLWTWGAIRNVPMQKPIPAPPGACGKDMQGNGTRRADNEQHGGSHAERLDQQAEVARVGSLLPKQKYQDRKCHRSSAERGGTRNGGADGHHDGHRPVLTNGRPIPEPGDKHGSRRGGKQ